MRVAKIIIYIIFFFVFSIQNIFSQEKFKKEKKKEKRTAKVLENNSQLELFHVIYLIKFIIVSTTHMLIRLINLKLY